MLITELKAKENILQQLRGKVFMIHCHGCREIRFPWKRPWLWKKS